MDAGTFLDRPVGQPKAPSSVAATKTLATVKVSFADDPNERPGARIGRYKLLQQIGEGGCGTVFMAEQALTKWRGLCPAATPPPGGLGGDGRGQGPVGDQSGVLGRV